MTVEVAAHAGFCMGVRRAVEAAEQAAADGIPSCTLGELIHNPAVVNSLAQKGLQPVNEPSEAKGRRVLIRSHGVSPEVIRALRDAGCEILDLTCPFVTKLHRIVQDGTEDGTPVILVGEKEHPEVRGTAGWAKGPVYTAATTEEAGQLPQLERAIAVAQTTFPPERWEAILQVLRQRVGRLESHCTICNATAIRQKEAAELAARAEIRYETYAKVLRIESRTMAHMASKHYIPAVINYTTRLAQSISAVTAAYTPESAGDFRLEECDFAIDAIDSVPDKAHLIRHALAIPSLTLFSSMGAARRLDPLRVRIDEFSKVQGDGLARALRNRFRRENAFPVRKFKCVWSDEPPGGASQEKGSLMQVTAAFGLALASLVVKGLKG